MELKRTKVVMLPTEDKASINLNTYRQTDQLVLDTTITNYDTNTMQQIKDRGYIPQYLYFVNDEPITPRDYVICNGKVYQISKTDVLYSDEFTLQTTDEAIFLNPEGCKKIIATTDKSLRQSNILKDMKPPYLPQPSQAFIQKYCELGGIDEVNVEYVVKKKTQDEMEWEGLRGESAYSINTLKNKLKLDSHNTITIHPIKDSWNREEVIKLCKDAWKLGDSYGDNEILEDSKEEFNKFIKDL